MTSKEDPDPREPAVEGVATRRHGAGRGGDSGRQAVRGGRTLQEPMLARMAP